MSYVMTPLAVICSTVWFQKVSQAYRWWCSNKLKLLAAADVSASYFICSCVHLLLDLGKNILRYDGGKKIKIQKSKKKILIPKDV